MQSTLLVDILIHVALFSQKCCDDADRELDEMTSLKYGVEQELKRSKNMEAKLQVMTIALCCVTRRDMHFTLCSIWIDGSAL